MLRDPRIRKNVKKFNNYSNFDSLNSEYFLILELLCENTSCPVWDWQAQFLIYTRIVKIRSLRWKVQFLGRNSFINFYYKTIESKQLEYHLLFSDSKYAPLKYMNHLKSIEIFFDLSENQTESLFLNLFKICEIS